MGLPVSRKNPKSSRHLALHLVSDLDGTWIPRPGRRPGLRRLEAFLDRQPGIVVTFATGRSLASTTEVLASLDARLPDHLVTDVGTGLYHQDGNGGWVEDQDYAAWVEARWPADLAGRLAIRGLPEGVRHQAGAVPRRRLALEVEPGWDLLPAAGRLREALDELGAQADVLPSGLRYLDVLPTGVDKGVAVRHLGLPLPVVACGDSENDRGIWRVADVPVVMADSPLEPGEPGIPWDRVVRPAAPGPEGILEVLRDLTRAGGAP
jgi:hypothetical protein